MQRIKDTFLDRVEETLLLKGLEVLEIGCGDGSRSVAIAGRCKHLTAVEPDERKLKQAAARQIPNATFSVGSAEKLSLSDHVFDAVIFTLSFHHIAEDKMEMAIDEAVRVAQKLGHIIFLEPTEDGTFFDAEILFDACDGDERKEKRAAYKAMMSYTKLEAVREVDDETVLKFDSTEDFIESMGPQKNQNKVQEFLEKNAFTLRAGRRITLFRTRT
ncbi:TPA: hypothetical protein DEB00_01380 [Candidatus Uhrbacteria bacterium]|nr:hypothetical protein [Candidatus Uhrbacteria bacterium]